MVFNKLPHVIFLTCVLIIITIGYFYFFEISPTFVQAPNIENPAVINTNLATNFIIVNNTNITQNYLIYFLNKMQVYKLHNNFLTAEKPVIEIYLSDINQAFYFDVINNKVSELASTSKEDPDIKITSTKEEIIFLVENCNTDCIIDAISQGKINFDVVKDEKTLALKGYKTIYDLIESQQNEVTSKVIYKLNPLGFTNGIRVSLLMFTTIIISLILEKEL
jgi:hypothetical protein